VSVAEFSLAGIRFRLVAPPGSPDILLPDDYTPFLIAPGTGAPDALYTVSPRSADSGAFDSGQVFWDNGLWRLRHVGAHGFDIEICDVQLPGWRRAARVESDFATGVLYPSSLSLRTGCLRPLHHPQDRTIVLGRLCRLGGAMIHSNSVLAEGKAMLFVGMSGTGKTTRAFGEATARRSSMTKETWSAFATKRCGSAPAHGTARKTRWTRLPLRSRPSSI
jgi:hypothetical protein